MDLKSLRNGRRLLSAAVSLSAVGLVMAKVGASAAPRAPLGPAWVLACCFLISLGMLIAVWRKEHAATEQAFAERAQKRLAQLQLELLEQRDASPGTKPAQRGADDQA